MKSKLTKSQLEVENARLENLLAFIKNNTVLNLEAENKELKLKLKNLRLADIQQDERCRRLELALFLIKHGLPYEEVEEKAREEGFTTDIYTGEWL
jgi:hypothetical protein